MGRDPAKVPIPPSGGSSPQPCGRMAACFCSHATLITVSVLCIFRRVFNSPSVLEANYAVLVHEVPDSRPICQKQNLQEPFGWQARLKKFV